MSGYIQRAVNEEKASRILHQRTCTHQDLNCRFPPRVSGQVLSSGSSVFICLRCFKTWSELDLPVHLRPHYEFGGAAEYKVAEVPVAELLGQALTYRDGFRSEADFFKVMAASAEAEVARYDQEVTSLHNIIDAEAK